MKTMLILCITILMLQAESFYSLSGIKDYDPMVINNAPAVKPYEKELEAIMITASKEIGIDMSGTPSRVLALLISRVSMGETIGLKVELEVGEYMKRQENNEEVFSLTYIDTHLFKPNDIEEEIIDLSEEMMERFITQYKMDNKHKSIKKTPTHKDFAKTMHYETNYKTALAKAKKSGKPLMVFMTTDFCPWCRKLENLFLSKPKINQSIQEKYIPLMLNLSTGAFPDALGKIKITPTMYILNSHNEKIENTFIGYNNRNQFLHILK